MLIWYNFDVYYNYDSTASMPSVYEIKIGSKITYTMPLEQSVNCRPI